MKRKTVIYLNGKFVSEEEAKLPVLSPGVLYGWGLFETMRSRDNKIVYLSQHLARIKESCRLLGVKFNYATDKSKKAIKEAIKISGLKDANVRLSAWKGLGDKADVCIIVKEYKPFPEGKYKQGFSCGVSDFKQGGNSLLAQHKTANYLIYQLAYEEARRKGFDEAIILNSSGYITEGSRANLFMAKNNMLFTPKLECGCLNGITRKVIFDLARKGKIEIQEGNLTLQNLYDSDEAFLVNSLLGIMPVRSVENITIGKAKSKSTLTGYLMEKYKSLLKNGN